MKKFFYFAAAAVMMLTAACQREMLESPLQGDTKVTFTVSAADAVTKADIADGTNVDILYWEIYDETFTNLLGKDEVKTNGDKTFTVELSLVADQNYNIIFWAEVEGKGHYVTDDLRKVGINYTDTNGDPLKANKEERAAFFRVYPFSTENGEPINEDVEIYRPFSQLNLGATTLTTSLNQVNGGQIEVMSTSVTVTKIANVFNTVSGKGEGEVPVTFAPAATPVDYEQQLLEVGDDKYHWLGMNYLVVNGDSDNVNVDIVVETSVGTVNHSVPNVPIKENYRTNILGDILTTGATFKVIVDEEFQKPDYITTLDGTYTLTSLADLQWFQQQVNKEGNTFEGKTVKLGADLDLQGAEWEPISGFKGTFDGSSLTKGAADNYTISNFTVNVNKNGGFFGSIVGNIKNVNIENATVVSNHFAGALVGYTYGRIENCHANNVTVTTEPELINGKYDNGDKAGAIVGYICGEPMSYLVNCSATDATVTAYRDLGAVAGCIAGTITVQGNTAKDCKIVVDQIIDGEYAGSKTENANPIVGRNQSKNVTAAEFEEINKAAESVDNTATTTPDEDTTLAELVAAPGAVIDVPAGEYTFPTTFGEGVTVNCAEGTVFTGNSKLNINGATVVGATFSNPGGSAADQTINGTFKDCVFEGQNGLRWCYAGETVVFENCVFSGSLYGAHFDGGANDVLFKNCTFSGFNAFPGAITQITFDGCTFVANGKSGYNGANLWGNTKMINTEFVFDGTASTEWIDCISPEKTYEFTGCTLNGGSIINQDYIWSRNETTDLTIDGVYYEDYMKRTFITTAEQLVAFANEVNVNKNAYTGKTVYLMADIDLAGIDWEPIGQTGNCTFNGVFEGNNHTISNLSVDSEDQAGAHYSSGLFGWVESHTAGHGHIKNVKIAGATVKGHHNCGALVGYITQETALVENCHVTGATISCTYANGDADGDKAGALIGNATVATPVKDCTAADSKVSSGRDAGQLIGAGREANVSGCSAANVTVEANGTGTGANVRNEVIGRLL